MALAYPLLVGFCLLLWSCANTFSPVIHDVPSSHDQCDESDPFEDDQELMEKLRIIHQQLSTLGCNHLSTCIDILQQIVLSSSSSFNKPPANWLLYNLTILRPLMNN